MQENVTAPRSALHPDLLRPPYINFALMTTLYFALVPQKF
jgi:hypothetical protein